MLPRHSCGFRNLPNSQFCGGCGRLLDATMCPSCNAANPLANRFCNQCGTTIGQAAGDAGSIPSEPPAGPTAAAGPGAAPQTTSFLRISFAFPSIPLASRAGAATASASAALSRWATPLLVSGAAAVALAQLGLAFSVELNEKAPIGYLLLLALGVALFAAGSLGLWARQSAAGTDPAGTPITSLRAPNILDSITGTVGVLTGILATGALLIPLAAGSVSGYMLLPWLVALAAFAIPLLPRLTPAAVSVRAWVREHYGDALAVLGLMGLFITLNLYDLQDWYYSAIGDEFLFFEHARHITQEGIARPFSQEGVYNKHPVMSSVFQAAVMKVFGADYLGWTLSEALNAAISIPGIYLLGHALGGRKAALVSAGLFASSHFILAFAHTGYNNLSSLPVAVWSLALFVQGWRKGNPLLLYAAGIIAGLGFYTHYSGRAILPIIFLFALTAGSPRRLLNLWPLALGFALTVAPTFAVEQEQVFTRMFGQVVGGYSDVVSGSAAERVLRNIEINLPAFNYNSTVHSYVYGPLLDPVSAALAVLGIGFALGHIRRSYLRLLLIWFGVAAIMTGVLSPYPHVAVTRLAFVVPPLTLLAGALAGQFCEGVRLRAERHGHLFARAAASALLAVLLALVLSLNLWQFWSVTPSVFPHAPEAVALGAFRSHHCASDIDGTIFVGHATGEGSLLTQVITAIDPEGPLPRRLNHDTISPDLELPGPPPRCVVFVNPGAPEARTLQEELARRYPEGRVVEFVNPAGTTSIQIFARPQD